MSERLQLQQFEQVMDRLPPEVASLARQARALILEVCPESYEVVWVHQGTVGYGTGPKKMSEHYGWLQFTRSYVQLGFNYGSELKDPQHLLEGTGAKMRHVKIRTAEELDRPGVRALLRQAIGHRVPPPQPLSAEATSTSEPSVRVTRKPTRKLRTSAKRAVTAAKKRLGGGKKTPTRGTSALRKPKRR